jgi:outer membrane biosynthesis protein TonB
MEIIIMNITEQHIREFAYQIWESEGRPHGHTERHWEMASKLARAHAESEAPQQPQVNQAGSTEPAPSVEPIHPISPTQPAQPVPPSDPIQPTDPVHPSSPAEPTDPGQPVPVAQAEQISELLAKPKRSRTKSQASSAVNESDTTPAVAKPRTKKSKNAPV